MFDNNIFYVDLDINIFGGGGGSNRMATTCHIILNVQWEIDFILRSMNIFIVKEFR